MTSRSLPAYDQPRPDPDRPGYVSATHSVHVKAQPEVVRRWNDSRPLEQTVKFEATFPAVVATEPLIGDWTPGTRAGNRRRVRFADGSQLAEEVLVDSPTVFRYLIWGFTSRQRFAVRQGLAEFRHDAEQDGTRLTWTYSLLPTLPVLRPLVRRFLRTVMTPMMLATLAAMRDGIEGEWQR